MSKIALTPNGSGSGVFTLASPNSNTNRTITLPDESGTLLTSLGGTTGNLTVSGNFSADGGTIKLDGNYPTGTDNVALGNTALDSNVSGVRITAIGSQALTANTASDNTAIGARAMASTTSGANNVAVGRDSLFTNSTGAENVSVGLNTMYYNTTGANNTALGRSALQSNTTASDNTAVGYQALLTNTTGEDNTATGTSAMKENTTGSYNSAYGVLACDDNTTGGSNVGIGHSALRLNTTGASNTAVGESALTSTTGGQNTAIGAGSGNAITSGTKNTILGMYTGNQHGLDIRTENNIIVLSDGDGNPRLWFDSVGTAIFENSTSAQNNNVLLVKSDYPSSNTTTLYMEADGDIATRSGSYGTISDQRLKQQITTANSQWDDVKAAVVRKYKFNADVEAFADDAPEQIGWVAQELETAGLNGVVKDGQDGFKSVKTTVLMIKAFKALQEAMARIETLETKVATLEG